MLIRLLRTLLRPKVPSQEPKISPQGSSTDSLASSKNGVVFITADGSHAYSPLASIRLRVLIPARQLESLCPVMILGINKLSDWRQLVGGQRPVAVVIGKISSTTISNKPDTVKRLLDWLGTYGRELNVFADLTDNFVALSQSRGDPRYEDLLVELGRSCRLLVSSAALARRLTPYALKGLDIIEDPWESPVQGEPRASVGNVIRLAWFGVADQLALQTVEGALRDIGEKLPSRPIKVEMVSGDNRKSALEDIGNRVASLHPNIEARFLPWSPETTWEALARCDFVLLPQDENNEWAATKSHNRLVESIRAGRLALASPIESYLELAQFAWIGKNLGEGLLWAIENPDQVLDRVKAGQVAITSRFSPEVVGRRWAEILGVGNDGACGPVRGQATPLRLNLGCGDKIIEGYVNVDIAPARGGKVPDVICDLRRLIGFADNSVDEILSIHVIEHFWRWEVPEVLREWVRVLRPGGCMILECPNLLSACQEILRNPIGGARADAAGRQTMWALYGDPSWKDPLMGHRWSYTPESLASLMQEAGMHDVRQEPAQFKMREPRDMRLVGIKPMKALQVQQ